MADDEQAQLQDVLEDLGDDNAQEERDQLQAQLFGAEDEPEDVVAGLEDEDEDAGAEEEVAAGPSQSKDDRKNSLKLLAKKRKQEEEEEIYGKGGKKSKKAKKDKAGKSKRSRASELVDEAAGEDADRLEDVMEMAEDAAFIDDEGAEPVSDGGDDLELGGGGGGDGGGGYASEAEEDLRDESEIDGLLNRAKRKKKGEDEGARSKLVTDLIARMEVAAEEDVASSAAGRPAVQKLKHVANVTAMLSQHKYQVLFIASKGLAVLRAWLAPYANGDLPNTHVRTAVLKLSAALPIDTSQELMKEQLRRSGLAGLVKFYSLCEDETPANRKLAADTCQRWARPIFLDPHLEEKKREQRAEAVAAGRAASAKQAAASNADTTAAAAAAAARKARPGEPGFRWHAMIPQSSKLDYVTAPAAEVQHDHRAKSGSSERNSVFAKKMREVTRKQKASTARAMQPSIEGRGMVMYTE